MHIPARLQSSIVDAIERARTEAKISRKELSLRLDTYAHFMQKIESGGRDVSASEFVLIVQAIGADPCEVLRRAIAKWRG